MFTHNTKYFSCPKRVYYTLMVWRFEPIMTAVFTFSRLSGGLRLRTYRSVARGPLITFSPSNLCACEKPIRPTLKLFVRWFLNRVRNNSFCSQILNIL